MKKKVGKILASVLALSMLWCCPGGALASGTETEVWYINESFEDMNLSIGEGNNIPLAPAGNGNDISGWIGYNASSKKTYGSIGVGMDAQDPNNRVVKINRWTDANNGWVIFGYNETAGLSDDVFTAAMKIRINPADATATGDFYRNSIVFQTGWQAWPTNEAYITFTTKDDPDSDKNIPIVSYYDIETSAEVEIPGFAGYKTGEWIDVRLEVNNTDNTYDVYLSQGELGSLETAVASDIAFNETIFKFVLVEANRTANDANGQYGGGLLEVDDFKIGSKKTVAGKMWEVGKVEKGSSNFDNLTAGSSLISVPNANLPWLFSAGTSKKPTTYGDVMLLSVSGNNVMQVFRNASATGKTMATYITDATQPNGINTVQFRYKPKTPDITANQFDIVHLLSDASNQLGNYGAHLIFRQGNIYIGDPAGSTDNVYEPASLNIPNMTLLVPDEGKELPTMQVDTWYNIKIVVDTTTKTYDVYITDDMIFAEDAVPVKSDIPLYISASGTPAEKPVMNILQFAAYYSDQYPAGGGYNTYYHIDDVLINPDNTQKDMYGNISLGGTIAAGQQIRIKVPLNLIWYNSTYSLEGVQTTDKLIAAVYDSNDKLLAINLDPAVLDDGYVVKNIGLDADKDYTGCKVRAFLLNGAGMPKPLVKSEGLQ